MNNELLLNGMAFKCTNEFTLGKFKFIYGRIYNTKPFNIVKGSNKTTSLYLSYNDEGIILPN